jgi:predicted nuclease of predicted toxin-antitoxin system
MKFLLDMGISPETGSFLTGLGYEAVHLHEKGLDTLPDPSILEMAREEGHVILTHDLDFPELVAASGARLPTVVVFRLRNMKPENVAGHLRRVLDQCSTALEEGAVISVTEALIRIRALPIHDRQSH